MHGFGNALASVRLLDKDHFEGLNEGERPMTWNEDFTFLSPES
jgi:hypothetical protein